MAKRKTRSKKSRARKSEPMAGWVWGLFGLVIGLSVAAAIYVKDQEGRTEEQAVVAPATPGSTQPAVDEPATTTSGPEPQSRFKFYDMLPNFEVVIPEEDTVIRPNAAPEPLNAPGVYVLQAGSFSNNADADRRKAHLALLGIVARIQKVSVDDKSYHRVRIGPVDELDELNTLRSQLREAKIDVMVIRVGD